MITPPTPNDVFKAHQRIQSLIERTPVMRSETLNRVCDAQIFFKCEQLQKTGSFKFRGASHAVSYVDPQCQGVATHSSGNHGAALALAAQLKGLQAQVVMPQGAIVEKARAVTRYGGVVEYCEPTQQAREAGLAQWVDKGWLAIPPYEHPHIIAGQGTCGLELMEQVPDLDFIVSPIGGGGLISGLTLATQAMERASAPKVIGIEPQGADDTHRSLHAGHRVTDHQPKTCADGLRALVGEMNLEIITAHVHDVWCVSEDQITEAMVWLWQNLKQVVEPSGAVALAGVMAHPERFLGKRVGVILSGGNMDLPCQSVCAMHRTP